MEKKENNNEKKDNNNKNNNNNNNNKNIIENFIGKSYTQIGHELTNRKTFYNQEVFLTSL